MTGAVAQKFTFDLDLTQRADKSRLIGETQLADALAAAEKKGYERGLTEGEASASSKHAEALAKAVEKLANRTAEVTKSADQSQRELLTDAANLAVTTARKLAANLIARNPIEEVRHLMDECLSTLGSVPHLVIRCHPEISDKIKQATETKMKSAGFEGRLVVMGDPDIMLGDARFEWVDGGLVRDLSKINAEIDFKLIEYVTENGAMRAGENS